MVTVTIDLDKKPTMPEGGIDLLKHGSYFETVIDSIPDAIFVFERNGRYMLANNAAAELYNRYTGLKKAGSLSESQIRICNDNLQLITRKDNPIIRLLKGEHIFEEEFVIKCDDQEEFYSISGMPVYDEEDKVLMAVVCCRETSAYRKELMRLNEQCTGLLAKYSELEKLLQYKEEWILAISHEFKTPLTVINSAMQAIEAFCRDNLTPKLCSYLKKIKQNNYRQIRLVNNLIEISRKKAGGDIRLNLKNIDIVRLTELITQSVGVYARQKGMELGFETKQVRKVIAIDEEKFERILLNLLSNAIKFSLSGGKVTVSLDCKNGKVEICVSDTGIGMSSDNAAKLFTRFGQVSSDLSRQAEGTGIGLYLVRILVESLGGEVHVQSKENEGTKFTVILNDSIVKGATSTLSAPTATSTLSIPSATSAMSVQDESQSSTDNRIQQAIDIEFSDLYY